MRRIAFKALHIFIFLALYFPVVVITKHFGLTYRTTLFINVLIAMIIYGAIQNWLINITDKYLFQKDYNFFDVLNQISDGFDNMQRDKTYPGDLKKYITSTVMDKLRLENAIVLEQNEF